MHYHFFAAVASGLEPVLLEELSMLGVKGGKIERGGVSFRSTFEDALRVNLWTRVANRVLWSLVRFPATSWDDVYEGAKALPWEDHLRPDQTFAVDISVAASSGLNSQFGRYRVKDAVADRLRDKRGARPNVDASDPDLQVHCFFDGLRCQVSVDLSGEPLFKRGYRRQAGDAPLKETLAAGVLRLTRWPVSIPLIDPMCGSGTIVIEAAMMQMRLAPGRHRSFAFERHPRFDEGLNTFWRQTLQQADDETLLQTGVELWAADRDPAVIEAAKENARLAGVASKVEFSVSDVARGIVGPAGGWVVSNPPYGERMGKYDVTLEPFYRILGQRLGASGAARAWLLASNPRFEALLGTSARNRYRIYNGAIETWLLGFGFDRKRR